MNIKSFHPSQKNVSARNFFNGEDGSLTAIQVLKNHRLKEHVSQSPALLVCLEGAIVFSNEKGKEEKLLPGDYINIEPLVKHWLDATADSQLLLFK